MSRRNPISAGPLALVRNGDRITLDVAARTINLDVPEAELAKRRAEWKQPERRFERGYGWMFSKHIKQANEGCDFDFLETDFGAPVGEPSIYSSARHIKMKQTAAKQPATSSRAFPPPPWPPHCSSAACASR